MYENFDIKSDGNSIEKTEYVRRAITKDLTWYS